MFPQLQIHLDKIYHNSHLINDLCIKNNIELIGVSKAVCGNDRIIREFIRAGINQLADSRLENIIQLKNKGIIVPFILLRSPMLSKIKEVVELADISFNSELEVIKALSEESLRQNKIHKVILMIETGDLREGVMPGEVMPMVSEIVKYKGVKLVGLGTNLACLSGVVPSAENQGVLIDYKNKIEKEFRISIDVLSGANSSSLTDLIEGNFNSSINQIRVGEGILLGRETINRNVIPDAFTDAFILKAELIEIKEKPSKPWGEISQNAFGDTPHYKDTGIQKRGIVALGKLDVCTSGIYPLKDSIKIIDANSDHLLIDLTSVIKELRIGDVIEFGLEYSALILAIESRFVHKKYIR